jgi:hypothetical protein
MGLPVTNKSNIFAACILCAPPESAQSGGNISSKDSFSSQGPPMRTVDTDGRNVIKHMDEKHQWVISGVFSGIEDGYQYH